MSDVTIDVIQPAYTIEVVSQTVTIEVPGYVTNSEPVTLVDILAFLGAVSYANLAAANAGEGEIGVPYYDVALSKLKTTTDIA